MRRGFILRRALLFIECLTNGFPKQRDSCAFSTIFVIFKLLARIRCQNKILDYDNLRRTKSL